MYAERTDKVASWRRPSTRWPQRSSARRTGDAASAPTSPTSCAPAATIQARVEALQDGVLPASAENLAVIGDKVQRLGRLLGELRSLDDMDAADFSLERRPLRLDELADEAVAAARRRFAQKDVQLALETVPVEVLGDHDRLRQVAENLLSNALEFTPSGGHVQVLAGPADAPPVAELSVSDDGTGIAPEEFPHVFERFFRGEGAHSAPGAGLGLAIARRLVEAHDGAIRAESGDHGGGCSQWTFRLSAIPRRVAAPLTRGRARR